jgi:hypothetical protein
VEQKFIDHSNGAWKEHPSTPNETGLPDLARVDRELLRSFNARNENDLQVMIMCANYHEEWYNGIMM